MIVYQHNFTRYIIQDPEKWYVYQKIGTSKIPEYWRLFFSRILSYSTLLITRKLRIFATGAMYHLVEQLNFLLNVHVSWKFPQYSLEYQITFSWTYHSNMAFLFPKLCCFDAQDTFFTERKISFLNLLSPIQYPHN